MDYDLIINKYKDLGMKILKDLVAIPSVLDEYKPESSEPFGKYNKEALDYILNKGEEFGFKTKNVDNYAGHIEYGSGKEILGILAHLDVVPVTKEEWDQDPFLLTIKDNKMFGRGTTDDKGPLVASLIAMKILKDEGYKPNKKIRLIMGCDEESGSRCLERYLEKEDRPDLAFSPDADFPLIYGEKGILSYDIVGYEDSIVTEMYAGERYNIVPSMAYFKLSINKEREFKEFLERKNYKGEIKDSKYIIYGESSHAMDPDKGINAIYLMFEFLFQYTDSKLAEFVYKYYLFDNHGKKADYYDYDEEMKDLTSNLAIIRLENQKFKLGFNVRCPKDDSFDVIPEKVSKIAGIYRYRFELLGGSKRHYVNRNTELVQKLLKAYQEITNDYSEPITIGGGTYARELGNAVAFGPQMPGRPDVCHISNEYMRLEDFFNAIKIYYLAIKELTK